MLGGHTVGSANGRGVAISTRGVPLPLDLLAAIAALAREGCLAQCVADAAWHTRRARTAQMGRNLPGWQLCTGKKGGSAVGKTKRGKGTKWMVLVDGKGLPMGVRLESASPSEVTLAEATLAEVRVPRSQGRPRQSPSARLRTEATIPIRCVGD